MINDSEILVPSGVKYLGEFISTPAIKVIMKNIYSILNINKNVPATTIQDYYVTKITKYNNIHGHRIISER